MGSTQMALIPGEDDGTFVAESFEGFVFKNGPPVRSYNLHIELGRCLIVQLHVNFSSDTLDQGPIS